MSADARIDQALELYERAVYAGDTGALAAAERALSAVEADLLVGRGRVLHARFLADRQADPGELGLFEQALGIYRALGDPVGEAEALFWVGCFHQVVLGDHDTAVPLLEQAAGLAGEHGARRTQAEALRHLGIAAHAAGKLDRARERLEESVRLRRELGLWAGVAANQVGLIHLAAAQGRHAEARELAEEAAGLAAEAGAARILGQVEEARAHARSVERPEP
ncbi:tetratricopeptide repeat protein [Nonomuraea sp. NPDC050328]|uniref:tetratricopeptide repeat protein n=1 Tax=Nonomuraea sp. NPDC050328 TaxID=3364361 RepID=UPI0037BC660D